MKKLGLIFLAALFSAFIDGGDDGLTNFFRFYDPSFNMLYISVNSELTVSNDKKPKKLEVTNNIAVYDITNDSTKYIFKKGFEETINEIIFEESFNAKSNSIKLNIDNEDDEYYYSKFCVNNFGVTQRELSSKLIIETVSVNSWHSTLWLCNKNGTGLEKISELKDDENYYLDTKGRNILVIKKLDSQIEVKKIKY